MNPETGTLLYSVASAIVGFYTIAKSSGNVIKIHSSACLKGCCLELMLTVFS